VAQKQLSIPSGFFCNFNISIYPKATFALKAKARLLTSQPALESQTGFHAMLKCCSEGK
jgi:hypothetical protein